MSADRAAFLNELITNAKEGYDKMRPILDEMTDAYLLIHSKEELRHLKERNKSQIYIGKINAKAKRIMDALSDTYFNNERFCEIEGFINSDDELIEMWQKAVDFYASRINLYQLFQPEFLKISFLGTAVAKVFWDNKAEMPAIEMINLHDIYFDPSAQNFSDMRYCVNKVLMTSSDIKLLQKSGVYDKKIELKDTAEYERVKIYDIYYKNGEKWYLSTIYDGEILRDEIELKDGLPIIAGYMLPQIKKSDDSGFCGCYGEPALSSIMPLQKEVNISRNLSIEAARQNVIPKLVLPKTALVDRRMLENPTSPIYTNSGEQITILPQPNINSTTANLALIENDMSEISGISPQQNGASTTRAETATMSSIMASEGGVRLQGYIRTLNETWFEPLFLRLAILVWKYGDSSLFGGFDRDEVMSFKVNLNTGIGALNKEVQKRNFIEGGGLVAQHFQMRVGVGDINGAQNMLLAHAELIARLMPLFGVKDFDKYIRSENDNGAIPAQGGLPIYDTKGFGEQALSANSPVYSGLVAPS